MLVIILVALFIRISDFVEIDEESIGRAIVMHDLNVRILKRLRPIKINIPIFMLTLANYQYSLDSYNRYFFPINVSKDIIAKVLLLMSYTTNWVNGTGKYNIKSLNDIDTADGSGEPSNITNKIYALFQTEINKPIRAPSYREHNNKYKIKGYYDLIYSSYIREISSDTRLSIATIISYASLRGDHSYCYNNISWKSNIYQVFNDHRDVRCLDCFSSPLYPVIKPYCSLLPQDTFFDGCMGAFNKATLNRVKPNVLFCNPTIDPWTGKYCMETLDNYLEEEDALCVITTQCTFGKLTNYVDTSSLNYDIIASSLLDHCFKSDNLLGFLIIPISIVRSSLIYTQNIRLVKSLIEIESAYIMLFYGSLPRQYNSLNSLKKLVMEKLRQNWDDNGDDYVEHKNPSRAEVLKIQKEYGWTHVNLYREMTENIRLIKSYFND